MFTSRAEFRLHLRIDNADRRLTPHGRRIGLIDDEAWRNFEAKQQRMAQLQRQLETQRAGAELPTVLAEKLGSNSVAGQTWAQLLRRPEISIDDLVPICRQLAPEFFVHDGFDATPHSPEGGADVGHPTLNASHPTLNASHPTLNASHPTLDASHPTLNVGAPALALEGSRLPSAIWVELKSVETEVKYAGYLQQQEKAIERLKKAESKIIPDWFDYATVSGLSREIRDKLMSLRPQTIGQASRLPGVTPAAAALLNVYIEIQSRQRKQASALGTGPRG
jgi:tRNA uridine 5-carboxymethylaminomethyl modification enzyme